MKYRIALFTGLILFCGCLEVSDSEPEEPPVELRIQKTIFQASETIEIEVFNPTSKVVHLQYCGPDLIREIYVYRNNTWERFSGVICTGNYTPTFEAVVSSGAAQIVHTSQFEPGYYRYELNYTLSSEENNTKTARVEFTVR